MRAYYNENDKYCAQWLRNLTAEGLIPDGEVDDRSILDVRASDLAGFTQCHFFAGLGGWSRALELAAWPASKSVWTGSCPCQPLSSAGQRKGHADERHLWPAFYRLISECKPPVVFGEQVASKDGREWFAGIRADLEALGLACGAADLCAAGVGAPHARQRLWWVATLPNSDRGGWQGQRAQTPKAWCQQQFERLVQDQLQSALPTGRMRALSDGIFCRTSKLRALGNAIVPQVAAEFIGAYLDTEAAP